MEGDPADRSVVIKIIGPMTVEVDAADVRIPPAARRLLSILLLDPATELSTDTIIDRMWGDDAPPTARTSLHVHISTLRKHLPGVVVTTGTGYRLEEGRFRSDRGRFESFAQDARGAGRRADWEAARDLAEKALGLWRGSPFAEVADDEFARGEVVRLDEVRVGLFELQVDSLLALGRNDQAIPRLRALIGEHPLRERFREQLMLALYRTGRQSEALREYQILRRQLGETLGIEPNDAIRDLEGRILMHDPSLGAQSPLITPHNLPEATTSFVGRLDDLRTIVERLAETRLVTVIGGPGFGKSRLAVEVGRAVMENQPGGVWLAELAGADSARSLAATVASVTGASEQIDTLERLAQAIRSRPILLILDNCEHLQEPVRRLLAALLAKPGACRVLATSRIPLSVPGESIHRLVPLDTGPEESVALLIDRVRDIDRSFVPDAGATDEILALCSRLGGLPLGIELVARWIPSLGVRDTGRLLQQVHGEDALETAFEWSARLIPNQDHELLCSLSIFYAPFTLERAQSVCAPPDQALSTAGSISRLVDASLMAVEWSGGETRYQMLESIRELAGARLEPGRRQELVARHAASYLDSAASVSSASSRVDQAETFAMLDVEIPDYRATLSHLKATGDWAAMIRVAEALSRYWYSRYLGWEGRSWLDEVPIEHLDDPDRIRLHRISGFLAWAVHDYETADRHYTQLLAIGRRTGNDRTIADALYGRGLIHQKRRFEDGAAMLEEAASLYRGLNECGLELGQCLLFRGLDESLNGDAGLGERLLGEAVVLLEEAGHMRQVSKAERWRAHSAWRRSDPQAAQDHANRAEHLARSAGDPIVLAGALVEQANIEITWGDLGRAAQHLGEAMQPIPADDEVDTAQVLISVARLALAVNEGELAAGLISRIEDVYERYGWLPLDDSPTGRQLVERVDGVPVTTEDPVADATRFLRSMAQGA
jgi:predicted ATPase/DNA-binding winged helix-turn-helix (wHTH) protein